MQKVSSTCPLALLIPNEHDLMHGDKEKPGGDIYIHGGTTSTGCIAITNDKIKEIYLLAIEARNNLQENIPVHIFPFRFENDFSGEASLNDFWKNLKSLYEDFQHTKQLQPICSSREGHFFSTGD